MKVFLNPDEIKVLSRQEPSTQSDGGFQSLMVELQKKVDSATGAIDLNEQDLERIPRYAFDYRNGGWQGRLTTIFARTLGSQLGR